MSSAHTVVPIHLPDEMRRRLDRASGKTRRTRDEIVEEALARHLDALEKPVGELNARERIDGVLALAGSGVPDTGPLTPDEIDARVRWLRGDD